MKELFCSYEQALALKELGFDEPCFGFFDTFTNEVKGGNFPCEGSNNAPLKSQVFRWFRKEYEMFPTISTFLGEEIPRFKGKLAHFWEINMLVGIISEYPEIPYKTYEEAESACIDKLIEIIKEKK